MNELAEQKDSTAVSMFERLARDQSVDVDKLERLMAMNERMIATSAKQQFDAAFSEMQSELPSITERGEIRHDKKLISKYARFEDINDTCKPILQKHGFAISFRTSAADKTLTVVGILSHRGGHREETALPLPFDNSGAKNLVQQMGSSVSYGKRYVFCALLNITTRGEDDDGRIAGTQPISEDQIATLQALIEETGSNLNGYLRIMKVNALSEIPAAAYPSAVGFLEAKRKK